MKLAQETFQDTVLGAEKEMNFSISDDNSLIFEILRDKMYSNKVGSVCREIASNSRDANREAGNANVPIEIEIIQPSDDLDLGGLVGHMSIGFRDYGIGITPDRMENVFVKYAASTKRDSNAQTGGFGLGAKTPFAYTDTFTIITTCMWENKLQKFIYTAMIDSSRKGKMILFDSEDAKEDAVTGTQIVIPINKVDDRAQFEQECYNYTSFWGKEAVRYIGFESEFSTNEVVLDDENFTIFKGDSDVDHYKLIIDGIPYPMDEDQVSVTGNGLGDGYCIALKFSVGELTISANREAVQYDESTVRVIESRYKAIGPQLFDLLAPKLNRFNSYIDGCVTMNVMRTSYDEIYKIEDDEMRMMAYAFSKGSWSSTQKGILSDRREEILSQLVFEGKKIKTQFTFQHHRIAYVRRPGFDQKVKYEEVATLKFTSKNVNMRKMYVDKAKNIRRNNTIWNAQLLSEQEEVFMMIIPKGGEKKQIERINEMSEFCFSIGLEFEMYSDIEMCKSENSSYKRYIKEPTVHVACRQYDENATGYYRSEDKHYNTSISLEIDRATTTLIDASAEDYLCYVVDKLSDVNSMLEHDRKFRERIKVLDKFTDKNIIFCSQKNFDKYVAGSGIKKANGVFEKIRANNLQKWTDQRRISVVKEAMNGYKVKIDSSAFAHFPHIFPVTVQKFISLKQDETFDYSYLVPSKAVVFNSKGLVEKINAVDKKYPLLHDFMRSSSTSEITQHKKHIENYLQMFA